MKIKGIYRSDYKGKRRGDPIEYSSSEKAPLAVESAIYGLNSSEYTFLFTACTVENLEVFPMTAPKEWPFAFNKYKCNGSVSFRSLKLSNDKLFPSRTRRYEIEFADCADDLGQPDLEVLNFKLI